MYTKTFGMTKTNLTIATIRKTHHIIAMLIRESLVNSKTKLWPSDYRIHSLKSKMCSYIKSDEKGGKTAKGIKKNVIKNDIKH